MRAMAMVSWVSGDLQGAVQYSRRAALEATDAYGRRSVLSNLSFFLVGVGEWEEAETLVSSLIEDATRAQDVWQLTSILSTAAQLASWRGEYARAIDFAQQALRLTGVNGKEMDHVAALEGLGQALIGLDRIDEAVDAMKEIPELVRVSTEKVDVHHPLVVFAEANLLLRNVEVAERILLEARTYLRFNLSWTISVDRLAVQVALANANPLEALDFAKPWLERPSEIVFEQARLHQVAGRTYLMLGMREAAVEQAEKARALFARLGARGWEAASGEIAAQSARPRRGRPRLVDSDGLTPRESEVLRLVATGKTNREIGADLYISESTVKKHLENIKLKLGIRRRAELAVFAAPDRGE